MADYDNEELNSLKQWWDANGTSLVIGAVLGLAVIGGWQGWRWYTNNQANAAADTYAQVRQALARDQVNDGVLKVTAKLKDDYASTPYAADAALNVAAWQIQHKQYDKAAGQLDWTLDNAPDEGIRNIARVRKARLLWTQGNNKAALALLDTDHPPSFNALYAETVGDIHAAMGQRKAAHAAYQKALDNLPPDTPRQPLKAKLADNAPVESTGKPTAKETSSAS